MNAPAAARSSRSVGLWLLIGALAYLLLPWYFVTESSLLQSLGSAWTRSEAASGALQTAWLGRPWLAAAPIGLALGLAGWAASGRARQGGLLIAGGLVVLAGILIGGFTIGARGWSIEALTTRLGPLPVGQPGLGLGGVLTLLAALMLLGAGAARRGFFRGDLFTAWAVVL